jgi:predicted nucleic-acid-binding Zn-ribbon protein
VGKVVEFQLKQVVVPVDWIGPDGVDVKLHTPGNPELPAHEHEYEVYTEKQVTKMHPPVVGNGMSIDHFTWATCKVCGRTWVYNAEAAMFDEIHPDAVTMLDEIVEE